MRVMITGATGFLGRHMVNTLLAREDIEVVGVDYRESLDPIVNKKYTETICDIRDIDSLRMAAGGEKLDAIIHLAAIPSIAKGTLQLYTEVNVIGTSNVVLVAKELGAKRIIYTSSSTVYGKPKKCPIDEGFETPPIGKYGSTKLAAEKIILDLDGTKKSSGLDGIVIRPRVVMGAGRMGIFDILFNAVYHSNTIFMIGNGKNRFQFTDVRDLCEVISLFMVKGRPGLYNVGCDTTINVNRLLSGLVMHASSKSKIINLPIAPIKLVLRGLNALNVSPLMEEQFNIADLDFVLDTTKVRNELNWRPSYSDIECLSNAYDWWVSEKKYEKRQFNSLLGLLGRFKSSHQSGFQKN